MKCLVPIPNRFVAHLKRADETGIGYQVVSVELNDGRSFDQVATSEGCIPNTSPPATPLASPSSMAARSAASFACGEILITYG